MDHHTAVHIVGGAARDILGPHIRQAGSNKGQKYARIDLTHHSRMSRELLDQIEDKANDILQLNPSVEKIVLHRVEADAKYGFEIYQGGPPKHQQIRIIKIGDFDIQAYGGTHHDELWRSRRIEDNSLQSSPRRSRTSANRGRGYGERACEETRATPSEV